MAHVEAGHIHALHSEGLQHGFAAGGRPNGGNNLGAPGTPETCMQAAGTCTDTSYDDALRLCFLPCGREGTVHTLTVLNQERVQGLVVRALLPLSSSSFASTESTSRSDLKSFVTECWAAAPFPLVDASSTSWSAGTTLANEDV